MESVVHIGPDRVAAYIRWSTEEQAHGTTLEVQRAACESYIRSQGWHIVPSLAFVDDGYSGSSLDRPALAALRQAVRDRRVECVVVYTLDRLSRSVADTVDLVLREWDGRCHVRCVQQPIDTTHPAGKMFFYVLASYAEFERDMIRLRTLSGKKKRAREGANPGWRYNYGFRRGAAPGAFVVDEPEAEVVRRLFREYLAGKGFRQLALELNADGIRSAQGKLWSPNAVRAILSNPIYCGRLEYGKERRVRKDGRTIYHRSRVPRHASIEGAVPAIVDIPTWAEAQRRRRERAARSPRSLSAESYLLSGIARCARCLRPLAGTRSYGTRYYRCIGRRQFGPDFCDAGVIRAAGLESAIIGRVRADLSPESLEMALKEMRAQHDLQLQEARARARLLRTEADGLRRVRSQVDAAFDRGDLDPKLYNRRSLQLDEGLEELQARLRAAQEVLHKLESANLPADHLLRMAGRVDAWETLTPCERKSLLFELVERLTAYQPPAGRGGGSRNPHPVEADLVIRTGA